MIITKEKPQEKNIMKNSDVMTDYADNGQRIGSFTYAKKLINYLKYWTGSARLVFTNESLIDSETKWIGLGYFNPKKDFNAIGGTNGFIKCIRDDEGQQERDIFEIIVLPINPEIEED